MSTDLLTLLGRRLDESAGTLTTLDSYALGTQPAAYLSPESVAALEDRLRTLSVNYCRLAVDSLAERLQVTGFRTAGPDTDPDAELWRVWRANRLPDAADAAHVDALIYGRSFVIVWAGSTPDVPRVTVESARQVAVDFDPATRDVTAALKRWVADGKGHAVLYLADRIERYVSEANVSDPAALPPTGWKLAKTTPNPLGVVPVVPLVNRGRLLDLQGVSEMRPLLDLADALNKTMSDAMVSSEYFARPRRWVTGLEIVEDAETGEAVNPFSDSAQRVWQAEAPDTKFGQFDAARLDGYADLAATITQQIGALSGLPPHYLGLHGDQPASADAIRSAEASLVARALSKQRTFGQAWADVARLIVAVRDGTDPMSLDVETVWANPETRTPAQSADAAAKLAGIGVPLTVVLADQMGYSPAQVDRIREGRMADELDNLNALQHSLKMHDSTPLGESL